MPQRIFTFHLKVGKNTIYFDEETHSFSLKDGVKLPKNLNIDDKVVVLYNNYEIDNIKRLEISTNETSNSTISLKSKFNKYFEKIYNYFY